MTLVNKMDSNFTDLRYAVEETPGTLPGSPVWLPLEPNEYKDFGAELVTKARTPITFSRQRKKGVPLDINAQAGYVQDVTATNSEGLLQSFMFATTRSKPIVDVAVVDDGADEYQPAADGDSFSINDLLFAEGFDATANNGLKLVDAATDATSVPVSGSLTAATGQSGTITRVGTKFPSGFASINATASEFPQLVITGNVQAVGTLTLADNPSDGETVTINGRVYTFKDPFVDAADNVNVGATASDTIDNLIAAIMAGAGAGTAYGTGTTANVDVTAAAGAGDTMVVTAIYYGASGNAITTVGSAGSTFASGTLTTGAGKDLRTLGVIPGEFVFIGGDGTDESFALATSNGFARVREVTAHNIITFDKTQSVMVDDAGAAKTVHLYYGHPLKNEVTRALIVKRTLQFERQLGAPDESQPTQIQSEYVTNSLANECTLDAKTADFLTLELGFLSGDAEQRTAATGLKSGTRPDLVESDAFNTTSDISLIKMALVEDGDSCPTPLFAFLTDLKVNINNNVKQNKALSVFGAFDNTAGTFEVSAEVTAYFQTVAAITAARENSSATLEVHFVKENKGLSLDLPLITIGKVRPDVKLDEPIMLPIESDAATAKLIDPTLDYTLMWTFWSYLPDLAE